MTPLGDCKRVLALVIGMLLSAFSLRAQYQMSGKVLDAENRQPIAGAEVYNRTTGELSITNARGVYRLTDLPKGTYDLVFFSYQYQTQEKAIALAGDITLSVALPPLSQELSEVVIRQQREALYSLRRLRPVEGTAIYAGKKTEVVVLDQVVGNLAANNARQVYAQVTGLNIYDNNDGGLQLSIGGRGWTPTERPTSTRDKMATTSVPTCWAIRKATTLRPPKPCRKSRWCGGPPLAVWYPVWWVDQLSDEAAAPH